MKPGGVRTAAQKLDEVLPKENRMNTPNVHIHSEELVQRIEENRQKRKAQLELEERNRQAAAAAELLKKEAEAKLRN